MKAQYQIIFLISILVIGCDTQVSLYSDLSKRELKGRVRFLKSEHFDIVKIDSVSPNYWKFDTVPEKIQNTVFNEEGNLISEISYSYSGKVFKTINCIYDNELLESLLIKDFYGTGSFEKFQYSYNDKDSVEKIAYESDNYKSEIILVRDDNERLINRIEKRNDTIYYSYEIEYDKKGNLINENTFVGANTPYILISKTYENNRLKEENIIQYTFLDTLNTKFSYKYDNRNRLIYSKEVFNVDSNYIETHRKYNEENILIEEKLIPNKGYRVQTQIRKFDDHGNQIEITRELDEHKRIWKSNYEYDSNGNWIKRTSWTNNRPVEQTKRIIEYYK
ncbi:hypothetical protein J1N10_11420 [Carboxylicivirga sp. A043]|uniref:hypothetical protein n=1 Tax=Carboxylicivirga litoralis TaxID=2816963 RepID=UPI0021CB4BF3|nr:hypothetical protein [Carboxylicivirga sp. A043]MCU4156587.1 hypothetical protein [Carboxylicivirga sp. A043]